MTENQNTEWVCEMRGWWLSNLGAITLEGDNKWWFWPMKTPDEVKIGPFKTLKAAKAAALLQDEQPGYTQYTGYRP